MAGLPPWGFGVTGTLRGRALARWAPVLVALAGCAPPEAVRDVSVRGATPSARLYGVVFDGFREGALEVVVRAARADVDARRGVTHLDEVRIQFEDPQHGVIAVQADEATVELDSDDFVLRGNVAGTTGDGGRFRTAEVRYDATKHRLWTPGAVRLERSRLVFEGTGMELDVRERRVRFRGRVRATTGGA